MYTYIMLAISYNVENITGQGYRECWKVRREINLK